MIQKSIEESLHALFKNCGEDPEREGLLKTPQRFLKAFQELTQGYHQRLEDVVHGALFECPTSEPVQVLHIPFFSLCEHHLLPFFGTCHIAYLPNGCVFGLSKIYRIVNLFAQRLQLQERLTQQIGQAIQQVTGARGVRIEMDAQHLCVAMRGVQRNHSWMHTQFHEGVEIPHAFEPSSNDFYTQNLTSSNRQPTIHQLTFQTLEIPMHIGCFQEEQQRTTPIRLKVELQLPPTYGTMADDLTQTICYDQLMRRIQHDCLQQKFQLIEYAGANIYRCIQRFLMEQNKAARIKITLTKVLSHPLLSDSQYTIGDF